MIKNIHHIGIAVNNLKESVALYEKMLGIKAHITRVPGQKVTEAVFRFASGTEINLLAPMSPESVVAKFLERRGEGPHHIAFEVDAIDSDLAAMEGKGIRVIDRDGSEGVAGKTGFLHPKSLHGVLVELVEPRK